MRRPLRLTALTALAALSTALLSASAAFAGPSVLSSDGVLTANTVTAAPVPYTPPAVINGGPARSIVRASAAVATTSTTTTTTPPTKSLEVATTANQSAAATTSTTLPRPKNFYGDPEGPPPVVEEPSEEPGDDEPGGHDPGDDEPGEATTTTQAFTIAPPPPPSTSRPFIWEPIREHRAADRPAADTASAARDEAGNPLPYTGGQVTMGLAVAVALVTGGSVLVWAARRRPKHARGA